mgnify:CR=1 FL=1|tara:strand:+ start:547 stop:747 length:201 start_codon:yes stop_codon:yes gene_type:complete
MPAKNKKLMNANRDRITFIVNKKQKFAKINYYYTFNKTRETITCSIPDADERYDDAIKNGYKEMKK